MIPKSIRTAAATRFRSAPAAAACERELEPEPAAQRDLHGLRGKHGVGVAWDSLEPCSGVRTRLGTQERAVGRRQRRQQHGPPGEQAGTGAGSVMIAVNIDGEQRQTARGLDCERSSVSAGGARAADTRDWHAAMCYN